MKVTPLSECKTAFLVTQAPEKVVTPPASLTGVHREVKVPRCQQVLFPRYALCTLSCDLLEELHGLVLTKIPTGDVISELLLRHDAC